MPSPPDLDTRARAFALRYAALFSNPDASDPDRVGALARAIGAFYRPGMTMFTHGQIARFAVRRLPSLPSPPPTLPTFAADKSPQTQAEAAALIEREMRNNIASGLGTKLVLEAVEKVEGYAPTSALCWLRWRFEPAAGSAFAGRGWGMVNVYGFRAGDGEGEGDGWEFVLRDQEVDAMRAVTGGTFE